MKEHLININDAMEDIEEKEFIQENGTQEIIIKEVQELHNLTVQYKAGYVRFIEL